MTRERKYGEDTPYKAWLRNNPGGLDSSDGYDLEDVDLVWFDYMRGYMMLIEEKMNGAYMQEAQYDTFGVIHQALKYAFPRMDFKRHFANRTVELVYFGYYFVQFENTGPDDGGIWISNDFVTKEQLHEFHKFNWFPHGSYGEQQLSEHRRN